MLSPPGTSRAVLAIGGLFDGRRGERVVSESLRAMGDRMTLGQSAVCVGDEPAGLFATGEATIERSDEAWVVAELDLLNVKALHELVGLKPGTGGLLSCLYAHEGAAFVRRLRGAFAIALWDRRQRQLLLAVDHFGMRRLHYVTRNGRTAFASRVGVIGAAAGFESTVDPAAIYSYLNFGFVPAPETPYKDVRRLPPGHLLQVRAGTERLESFWDMTYPEETQPEERAAPTVYRLTHQAVSEALRNVPLKEAGAFLSGGTDSSTVVGLMSRVTGETVNAYSIAFGDPRYDELRYAELAARHFGASHYHHIVTPTETLAILPSLVDAYDEPFGNNSAVGTFFCARLARECGVTHLLAGDGGDEIFGGNERYRTDRIFGLYGRIPRAVRRGVLEPVLFSLPDGTPGLLGRARRYIRRANIPNPRRFYSYDFYVSQEGQRLLSEDLLRGVSTESPWRCVEEHFARSRATAELNRLLYIDLKLTLGDNDLLKVVRTAELAGVGVRFPLLSLPLVEYTGTLPTALKVRGMEKRYLFKRAFRSLLPPEILAKQKHGFGVPTSEWMRSHDGFRALARDILRSNRCRERGIFQDGAMDELFALHAVDSTPFYGDFLWRLLMLELWYRQHVDRAGAE
jgi:asparagine synthase (glutamine-hydrolysing)